MPRLKTGEMPHEEVCVSKTQLVVICEQFSSTLTLDLQKRVTTRTSGGQRVPLDTQTRMPGRAIMVLLVAKDDGDGDADDGKDVVDSARQVAW